MGVNNNNDDGGGGGRYLGNRWSHLIAALVNMFQVGVLKAVPSG